ncbi:hypothetical protein FQZ97_1163760 [compost metagenome]
MVPGQPGFQVGLDVGLARLLDAADGDVFHHHMGRHHDQALHRPGVARGVDQRYRPAIAVAQQPDFAVRLVHAEFAQQGRQHLARLALQKVGLPMLLGGPRGRVAVAGP